MHFIREIREASGLSQTTFAKKYNIPISTLRKWEQLVSKPPQYVINLLEASIPAFKQKLKIIKGDNNKTYYLDESNKKIYDSCGNSISFNEDIKGVINDNLSIYISELFNDLYQIQNKFDTDLKQDKLTKIRWR